MKGSQFFIVLSLVVIAPHVTKVVAEGLSAIALIISVIAFWKEIKYGTA